MKSLKYIALAAAAAVLPLAAQAEDTYCTEARLIWADVKDSGSASAMQAFVSTFPDCPIYKGLAEEKLATLAAPTSGGVSAPETNVARVKKPLGVDEEIVEFESSGRDYDSFTEVETSCMTEAAAPTQNKAFDGVGFSEIDLDTAWAACARAVKQDDVHPEVIAAFARVLSKAERYDLAMRQARFAAEQGSGLAMNVIASMYYDGTGVDQSFDKSFEWYEKSHNTGFAMATHNLGNAYADGEGVPVDEEKALEFYQEAADKFYPPAYGQLGQIYREGEWVERDMDRAMEHFALATSMGDALSAGRMGYVFDVGEHGHRQDDEMAFQAYYASVRLGNIPWVQHNLASFYRHGRGVDKDVETAGYYWLLAAKQGHAASQRKYGVYLAEQGRNNQALEWYGKAALQGDDAAHRLIEEMVSPD